MPGGVAFDELLDEKLAADLIDSRPAATFGHAGMATAYGFFFVEAPRTAVASTVSSERRVGRSRSDADAVSLDGCFAGATSAGSVRVRLLVTESAAQPSGRTRPARQLPEREQRALADLVTLGGALRDDFTFDELRSVFRRLARRYHPDRHAGCDEQGKAGLAERFARARDAYQILVSHVLRVH
jgi:hypothetical protein